MCRVSSVECPGVSGVAWRYLPIEKTEHALASPSATSASAVLLMQKYFICGRQG